MNLIGIVANPYSPLAAEGVSKLTSWLEEKGKECLLETETAEIAGVDRKYAKIDIANRADLIVVLGGDGTMIGVARLIEEKKTPMLGVNLGSLGFLTEFTYDEMIPALEQALTGDYEFEDRIMLDAVVSHDGKEGATYTALNDIVVHRGALSQMVDVHVDADGVFLNAYTADGLIVSTPTGSTAYNLASGGPIVHPSLSSMIISPICPHTLSIRSIVIPDNVEVTLSISTKVKSEVVATVDGQVGFRLSSRDKLKIRRSGEVTRIIRSPFKNYYELLRGKLKWGETIRGS